VFFSEKKLSDSDRPSGFDQGVGLAGRSDNPSRWFARGPDPNEWCE
jgi:hypothetical protein